MKIVISGGNGQLGKELTEYLKEKNFDVFSFGSNEMDITQLENIYKILKEIKPEVIINCAAYTKVDDCEKNIKKAFLVNSIGAKNIAIVSNKINAKLFHISTDYIFDGIKNIPYTEYDDPNPLSIYGKSKLFGEIYIKEHTPFFFILRVAGVYGKYGNNFVKTIIKLGKNQKKVKVVNDQITTPTWTLDITKQIIKLINTEQFGIYNASCEGECSWYEFTKYIYKLLDIKTELVPCSTEEFPRPAKRPPYSVLENFNLKLIGYNIMPHWKKSIENFLKTF